MLNNNKFKKIVIIPEKVSIVIPTYNREVKLCNLIKSIYKQQITNFSYEIIVVNNASSDDTLKTVEKMFINVQLINLDENRMSSHARNIGIEKASGEFIFFIDDDNVLKQDCLQNMYNALKADSKIGICAPLMMKYDNPQNIWCTGAHITKYGFPVRKYGDENISVLKNQSIICGFDYFPNAYMVRSSILITHNIKNDSNLFPHNWGETDFCLQIKSKGYKLCSILNAITFHDIGYNKTKVTRISVKNAFDQARSRILFFKKYQTNIKVKLVWYSFLFPIFILFYIKTFMKQKDRFLLLLAFFKGLKSGIQTSVK